MKQNSNTVLIAARTLLVAMGLLLAATAPAQEAAEEPSKEEPVSTTEQSVDNIEPGVSSSELSEGVVRRRSSTGVYDELELGSTRVTGNQELPKVLYIVPWKQADLGDLVGRPVNSLLDEVLEPVDRDVFRRQNKYYQDLYDPAPTDTE